MKRVPEFFLGILFAVAIFAMGMTFESSRRPESQSSPQSNGTTKIENSPDKLTDWLLVALNTFLVISTFLLWRANNRSAKIAERALTDLERPFVLPIQIETATRVTNGVRFFDFAMRWENSGRTPARNVSMQFNYVLVEGKELPEPFNYPDYGKAGSPFYIGPGGKHWSGGLAFPAEKIREIMNGNGLFFYGWAIYNDIFEGTSRHTTKFCWQTTASGDDPDALDGTISWKHSPIGPHNWIDAPNYVPSGDN